LGGRYARAVRQPARSLNTPVRTGTAPCRGGAAEPEQAEPGFPRPLIVLNKFVGSRAAGPLGHSYSEGRTRAAGWTRPGSRPVLFPVRGFRAGHRLPGKPKVSLIQSPVAGSPGNTRTETTPVGLAPRASSAAVRERNRL